MQSVELKERKNFLISQERKLNLRRKLLKYCSL